MLMIAIDVGTTNAKVIVFDEKGKVVAKAAHGYQLRCQLPGQAEEDIGEIWSAVKQGLKEVAARIDEPCAITMSTAMHSLIGIKNHQAITPLYSWADTRAAKYAKDAKLAAIAKRSGVPPHPMTPLVKLSWLKAENPDLYQSVDRWIDLKSFLVYQFTGKYQTDYSLADSYGFFDHETNSWDQEALQYLDLTAEKLPEAIDTTSKLEIINSALMKELGLEAKDLIIGASDGTLSNLAQANPATSLSISLGTSSAIRSEVSQRKLDPAGKAFVYYLMPTRWVVGAPSNNCGNIWAWWKQILGLSFEEMDDLVASSSLGSHGILFYPYLYGERAPLWDANASGKLLNLRADNTKADLLRAILEGILFNLRENYTLIAPLLGEIKEVNVSGGLAGVDGVLQMLADILNLPVNLTKQGDASALGAAMLGFSVYQKSLPIVDHGQARFEPNKQNVLAYEQIFNQWHKQLN